MHSPPSARIYTAHQVTLIVKINIALGDWRTHDSNHGLLHPISQVGSNRYSRSAAEMRDTLMTYFNSFSGTLPWQQNFYLNF